MPMKRSFLFLALVTSFVATSRAHDFSVTLGGSTIYFKITDSKAHTACLTYRGNIADHNPPTCTGTIRIPSTVRHDGAVYTINAIGPKALAGADRLEGIIIPESVKQIGDFAFEGCTSLRSVAMPTAQPLMGQGTFFRCTSIADINFGTNWTSIDFTAFRWSDSLVSVSIPAKVERIQGLKTLRRLRHIDVHSSNKQYASHSGCLYSTTRHTLLCVPRAYTDTLCVEEGTTAIMWGSIIDCTDITSVILPASVRQLSFREFSRMTRLQSLTIMCESPLLTTNYEGRNTSALAVGNNGVMLFVPKASVKAWRKALISIEGDYYDIVDQRPQSLSLQDAAKPHHFGKPQLLQSNHIKAIKTK